MKRYIWLTIFFVWLVMLSFLFSNISKNNNKKSITKNNIQKIWQTKKEKNLKNDHQNDFKKKNIWNKIKKENKKEVNNDFDIIPVHNSKNTWNNTNIQKENTQKIIPDNLYIWLSSAQLLKDSKFEEIFTLFWLDNIPLYQIEKKEIYIKQLSWNYKDIKTNFENIIKKIWGNDVETNLFWDRQTFFNPDIYYKKDVIMLIYYEKSNYLVVLPYKKYWDYKKFIKETLFEK